MTENFKIRELVKNHPEDERIVLNDILKNIIRLQIPLGKLEVHNYKDSVIDAVRLITEHEKLMSRLKYRIKNEVRQEVFVYHREKKKPNRTVHPNSLANLKSSKNK